VPQETLDNRAEPAAPPDLALAEIAAGQFGVVTASQARACGLDRNGIQRRLAAGRLQRLWRGVYAFGHQELRPEGRVLAAVLACGEGAVLSHRSAAARWGLLATARERIDVTIATRGGRPRREGIDLRCVRRLDPRDVTELDGIPITTPARTLVDLDAVVPDRLVERALDQAYVLRLLAPGELEDTIQRAHGRKTRTLRRLIAAEGRGAAITRSDLEERFLALVRRGDLREPEVNVRVHGYEVDFLWRAERRVVELDGYAFHSVRGAFERDRRKDVDLELAGYRVTRLTYRQVTDEPEDTMKRVKRILWTQ